MLEVRDRLNFEDYLDSLLNSVESDDLEFKSAAGGFPGSFWDTYSAFANLLDIPLLDHIVIGDRKYVSFREEGYI